MKTENRSSAKVQHLEHRFEEQARRTPGAIALCCGTARITYRELSISSNQLAHYLCSIGMKAESLAGVYLQRGAEMVVAMLGVLKSGAAYVPLDPQYPKERLEYIVRDSGLSVLLTQKSLLHSLPPLSGVRIVCLDDESATIARQTGSMIPADAKGENLAYVIYTSGSTGRPKGVAIRRSSAAILSQWALAVFGDDLKRVLAGTSICFDLSVFEILVPLGFGGTVYLVESVLDLPALESDRPLLVNTVPSVLSEVLRRGPLPPAVRTVNLAGEALRRSLVKQIYEHKQVQLVFNLYGPTEDTTYSTWTCLAREDQGPVVPIGIAVSNTQLHVLDEDLHPVAPGTAGELYISGDGLARGYINQPALTAERFLPAPFTDRPGTRMYRTGDRVRHLAGGELEFLGRLDEQIKIRGYRIELGEIEAVLQQHPKAGEVAVVAREDAHGNKRLVAYVTSNEDDPLLAPALRSHLARHLPDYMLPSQFVFLKSFPRTPTGKLAKNELPERELIVPEFIPLTEFEQALAAACAEVLQLSSVPLNSSFLELGGSSLNATRVIAALQERFQCDLPMRELLTGKSLREAAAQCGKQPKLPARSPAAFAGIPRPVGPMPASFSQERVWFVQKVDPSNSAYTFTAQITFAGKLNISALEKALQQIVQRHEIFRTTLAEIDGRLFQTVHDPWKVELGNVDMRGRAAEAQRFLSDVARKPFDLAALPLVRWNLVQLADEKYLFQSVEHHMVHDGWSYYVFLKELTEIYEGACTDKTPRIHSAPLQFTDFSRWQRDWMETPEALRQMQYWSETLADVTPLLSLPYDGPRPEIQTYKGECRRIELSEDLYERLQEAAKRNHVTPFMLCTAAFQILLFRYSGQDDFCIGTGIANRRWPEVADLIGMLVNNVALRLRTRADATVAETIDGVRETALSAYANQDLPFDQVVQLVQPARSLSFNPVFQVMWSFHDSPVTCPPLAELSMEIEQALNHGSAKFDMNVVVIPPQNHNLPAGHHAHAKMLWEYNTDLFHGETMGRMISHYMRVLEAVLTRPALAVSEIAFLSDAEHRQLTVDWSRSAHSWHSSPPQLVHQVFENRAAEAPQAPALVCAGREITYAELNKRANRLARCLPSQEYGVEQKIAVCLVRSPEAVAAFLAVLKAGHAYVPLDPAFPVERLAFMLEDTGASMVLTDQRNFKNLPQTNVPILLVEQMEEVLAAQSDSDLHVEVTPENLCYVMYTSGSTGTPKGVAVPHQAVLRLVLEADYVRLGADETLLLLAPLGFDASTFELWGALLHGGKLVLYPGDNINLETLEEVVQENHVSCLWLTASFFNLIIDTKPMILRGVRQVLAGGEALSVRHIDRAMELLPKTILINGYGPTEGTTFTCTFTIPRPRPMEWSSIPIGRPIHGTQVLVLDSCGQPAPIGVAGELYAGGAGLARGYLKRSDLTAEKFVPHPLNTEKGERLYRTGDIVKWRSDGTIEFLGRRDSQVKIRGHRIELDEIQGILRKHPAVKEAAVLVREDSAGEKRLAAYLVARKPDAQISDLQSFLKMKLPQYMLPNDWVMLEKLPLTAGGKLDSSALPAPQPVLQQANQREAQTVTEKRLAEIWQDVLQIEIVGVESDFFRLGGHSLKVMQIISRVREVFNVELEIYQIFNYPILADMALLIDECSDRRQAAYPPIAIQRHDGDMPLSFNEQPILDLSHHDPRYLAFNSQMGSWLKGKLNKVALQTSFNLIVSRHEALRTAFAFRNERFVRIIHASLSSTITEIDLQELREQDRKSKVMELATIEARTKFNLSSPPLMRIVLVVLAPDEHVLILTVHHVITDGWSLGLLARELQTAYKAQIQGTQPALPPVPLQYADFAIWQRQWLQGEKLKEMLDYWLKRVGGIEDLRCLEPDLPQNAAATNRQADLRFMLSKKIVKDLKELSQRKGVTVFMTLLGAFQSHLSSRTGAKDVVVTVPVSERDRSELETVIGLFINIVPMHSNFRGDPTFLELLEQVRATSQEAYAHHNMPYPVLFLALLQKLGRNPQLGRVMLDFINVPDFDIELPSLKAEKFVSRGENPLGMDLILFAKEISGEIECTLAYNTDLFSAGWAETFTREFVGLTEKLLQSPARPLSALLLPQKAQPGSDEKGRKPAARTAKTAAG